MSDQLSRVNKAIEVPLRLTADDGRVFLIRRWAPVADYKEGELVTVAAEMVVKLGGVIVHVSACDNTEADK